MSKEILLNAAAVIVFVGVLYLLYSRGYKKTAKKVVRELVVEAEKLYGAGKGSVKYAYVVDKVYDKLPTIVKVFLTEKRLGELIEEAVKTLEDKLE